MPAQPLLDVLLLMKSGQWTAAHDSVQHDATLLGAWLHGILHIQEGDLEDAEYWYGLAGRDFRARGSLAQEIQGFEAALRDGQEE